MPKVYTDLEKLRLGNAGALDNIGQTFMSSLLQYLDILIVHGVATSFDQSQILLEHACDGETDLSAEVFKLVLLLALEEDFVFLSEISIFGDNLNLLNENTQPHANSLFILISHRFFLVSQTHCRNLLKKFDGLDSSRGRTHQIGQNLLD